MTQIVPTFWPWHFFRSNSNNGPFPGHSNFGSDGRYTCSDLQFMVWWVPYLNKGPRSIFNNGPGNSLNSTRSLDPRRLFETDLNNGPSPSHSNPVSDGVYICSGLLLMVSWRVPYLFKGCRPNFNNGLGGDSNSSRSLDPMRLIESDLNNSPPKAIRMLNCKTNLPESEHKIPCDDNF